jgi:hypothetical protein
MALPPLVLYGNKKHLPVSSDDVFYLPTSPNQSQDDTNIQSELDK